MKRKNYSKELKSKVALAAIKGNQTVNEIASEFGIHTSLVNRWKKEAIEALPLAFGNSQAKQTKETEIERDRLYQKVGQLGYGCVTGNSGAMPGPKFATFSNWELPKDKPS